MKNTNKLKIKTQKAIDQHKLWKRSQDCFKEDYRRPAAGAQGGVGQGVFILSGQCSLECIASTGVKTNSTADMAQNKT